MVIKSTLLSRAALSCGFVVLVMSGCQTAQNRSNPVAIKSGAVPVTPVIAPVAPNTPATPPPPLPTPAESKKVALILGPGGAKALAHVGVLKAFQQQRIPVGKIVGLEWGALIGGLYADKGQINDVDWKLYKMEQKGLPRPKGFFSKKLGEDSVKIMDDFLADSFVKQDFATTKIPFACPTRSVWSGVVNWQTRGSLKDGVRRCLPFPPLFKVQGSFVGGASQAVEAIDWLRRDGYNVIIVVNVLGSAQPVGQDGLLEQLDYVILWQEVKRALAESSRYNVEFVNVDTSAYPMVLFESKKELIGLGEAAGTKAAGELVTKYGF